MDIISKLKEVLDENIYLREEPEKVVEAFQRLNVRVSKTVESFFENFAGAFWEETLGGAESDSNGVSVQRGNQLQQDKPCKGASE